MNEIKNYVSFEKYEELQAENKKLKELLKQFQTAPLYDEGAAPPKEILKCGI